MGFLDWLKEVAEQSQDAERQRLQTRHANDPAKLQRALARQDALNKTSNVNPYQEPEPDLDLMTDDEIEILRLQTEDQIESLQKLHGNCKSFADQAPSYAKPNDRAKTEAVGGFVSFLSGAITDYGIREKRLLLHKIAVKQRSRAVPLVQLSPAQLAVQKVAQQVSQKNEIITLLEQECEAQVKLYPDREAAIRRYFRKAIDAVLDEP